MSGLHDSIRGVILDLDGTLLDSMPLWHEIDLRFLGENGIVPPENIQQQIDLIKSIQDFLISFCF
ncbi:MAG: hypothetical protein II341_02440 [Oscillospiraceae bacterium]|nr:hypothetical protein [Oscillospiraceae bacterium]